MLRTLFTVGIMALVGLLVLKVAFGVLAGVLGVFMALVWVAAKILLVGAVAYLVLRIVAPGTAKRLRDRFTGTPTVY
ncbi:MAG TPA: hypothetical protein VJL28_09055 [Gemmatimonadaceae bacterium]|nr:hypothetical protein [Gemmatimonadaceae bacterium]